MPVPVAQDQKATRMDPYASRTLDNCWAHTKACTQRAPRQGMLRWISMLPGCALIKNS